MVWKAIKVKVKGGGATNEPPLGPSLAQYGLPVNEVVSKINELTEPLKDVEVSLSIYVETDTKNYRVEVKSPSTSSLLLKLAGASKPSGDPAHSKVGDLPLEDIVKVALMKKHELTARTLKTAVKTVLSTAVTIGLTVNGKEPKEVIDEVTNGMHDELLLKYEDEFRKGR